MALRLEQKMHHEGEDWWTWSVWLEGTDQELDDIARVEYTLHHTFPKPVRVVEDRSTKFRLDAAGWGGFTIHATAVPKSGPPRKLKHELELYYEDGGLNVR